MPFGFLDSILSLSNDQVILSLSKDRPGFHTSTDPCRGNLTTRFIAQNPWLVRACSSYHQNTIDSLLFTNQQIPYSIKIIIGVHELQARANNCFPVRKPNPKPVG